MIEKIRLSDGEITYLIDRLPLLPSIHAELSCAKVSGGEISCDTADEVRELCIERQDFLGFDENYQLTEEGIILNSLIDKLFVR